MRTLLIFLLVLLLSGGAMAESRYYEWQDGVIEIEGHGIMHTKLFVAEDAWFIEWEANSDSFYIAIRDAEHKLIQQVGNMVGKGKTHVTSSGYILHRSKRIN